MTEKIQKTIISKYLALAEKDTVNETDLSDLLIAVENLYKNRILTESDIYLNKIELIRTSISTDLETLRRKRTNKEIKLTTNKSFLQILTSDIEAANYGNTDLSDIDKFENDKEVSLSADNVLRVLENLIIPKRRISEEKEFEKFVHERLTKVFGKERVHRQYSIGGFLALKSDIDVGNGQVGIELKVADNLSSTDMQRLIGQVVYYKRRFYNNNLILFIASKNTINPTIKELLGFVDELEVKTVFTTAISL
ncbi:hypothetical protein [Hugenholtzia roseola]|uniref:hypothetical protein n=1 Tax=Hugenholtzia roseola TaxID=1002 RepID=UPI0004178D24|nr:hypothetical protein [Hugenholtzia roseola]